MSPCPPPVEALHRANHRDDVLHRGARLDIVNRVEHEAAVLMERFAPPEHLLAHLVRRAKRQHVLGVHPAAHPFGSAQGRLLQETQGWGTLNEMLVEGINPHWHDLAAEWGMNSSRPQKLL